MIARRCASLETTLALVLTWLLALFVPASLLLGCDDSVHLLDASLVSDTRDARGPYEVVVTVDHPSRVDEVTLWFRADESPWVSTAMRRDGDAFSGAISPIGFVVPGCDDCTPRERPWDLGTRIDWWVELQTRGGSVILEPLGAPGIWHSFVIGEADLGIAVLEVVPDEGPAAGGTRAFIYGAGFRPDVEVRFGPGVASQVEVISSSLLLVTTPPGPDGLVDVTVSDSLGHSGTLEDGFRYIPAPDPLAVSPSRGPTTGGTLVTITGEHFDPALVRFGTAQAEILSATETSIEVRTAPHPAGLVDVVVINQDGQVGTLTRAYEYVPPPVVRSVVPGFGPSRGGTVVDVLGSGFQPGVIITFDETPTACDFLSPTRLQCVTSPHPAGRVDVTAVNPDGQQGTGAQLYEYLDPPVVLEVIPGEGPITGGTAVEIIGRNFFPGAEVLFAEAFARDCVVVTSELMTCTTPAWPEVGPVDVTVVNPDDQQGVLPDGFEYTLPPPEIVSISPARGSDLGGTVVTLIVRWLQPGARVFLGDSECVVTMLDVATSRIECVTQPHEEGFVDVTVVNPDGQEDTEIDGYRFLGPPRIFTIDPPQGADTGGTTVTITGENFVVGMTVTFDGIAATVISIDEATSTAVVSTPAHPLGFVDVTVTNPDGRFDTAVDGYEYIWEPPLIAELIPPEGPTWGGNPVTIVGTGFRPGIVVLIDGVPLPPGSYIFVDANTIEILSMPPGDGQVDVEVRNTDGQSDSAVYTYVPITISPDGGLTAGHTRAVVSGIGFVPGAQVTIGGVAVLSVQLVDERTMIVETAAGPLGEQDLRVSIPDGRNDTVADAFTYRHFVDVTSGSGLAASPSCQALALVDIDNDGDLDSVVGNGDFTNDNATFVPDTIQRNSGNSQFASATQLPLGQRAINVTTADYDEDGDVDILMINLNDTTRLLRNDGSGNFTNSMALAPGSIYDSKFADFDQDGDLDLAFVHISAADFVLSQDPGHNFIDVPGAIPNDTVIQEHDHDLSVGDVNGDGFPDLVVGTDNALDFAGNVSYFSRSRLYINDQTGRFMIDTTQPFTQRNGDIMDTQLVDIDNDGDLDLLMSDNVLDEVSPTTLPNGQSRSAVLFYMNNGAGQFVASHQRISNFPVIAQGYSIEPVDLDEDGDLDLILSTAPDSGSLDFFGVEPSFIWVNDGAGNFFDATASWPTITRATPAIRSGDISGDGLVDLVFCNYDSANQLLVQRGF